MRHILLLLAILFSFPAFAAEKLVLKSDLNLYAGFRITTSPKWRLRRGQVVLMNSKPVRGFRAVRAKVKGETVLGYAIDADLRAYFPAPNVVPKSLIGFSYVVSQQSQDGRQLQTADDTTYDISKFSGSSQYFRLFADYRMSQSLFVRGSLVKRETASSGDAAVSGSATRSQIILDQSFMGLQGEMFYSTGPFWLGGGIEVSKGLSVTIKTVSGPEIEDSGLDKPFFTILSASGGASFGPYLGRVFLMPEVRGGVVVTTDPMTQIFEFLINIGYRLK